jgi:aspartyl-tRNA(Asn)/glutamyl-tRNA(Gln) amidotransferase subunit B
METHYKGYRPTIGLEIHAELRTQTKMFCDSVNDPHASDPNTHICPVCMGHPGTLPVVNEEAVKHVLTVGLAVEGQLADYTEFDRKNYFYPDIPKGYQISQYEFPLVKGGTLHGVSLTRVHLEEDTARSLHDQGDGSLVDYNRAGVPLMELVTEPVIHDAKTAGQFARELQLLLRTLGVSNANMEKGEMRVEANISVSKNDIFGTKVEVKNLNSFKSVESAIMYEIKRQADLLDEGGTVLQETRGWDETKGKTFSQRLKESANDYRYFPDPDIPKFSISVSNLLSRISENMPELPTKKREKYKNLGLTIEQTEIIIADRLLEEYFLRTTSLLTNNSRIVTLAANYLTSDVISYCNQGNTLSLASSPAFASLMRLVSDGKLTSRSAKDIIFEVVFQSVDPEIIARERSLIQENNEDSIMVFVRTVVEQNPAVVSDYKSGKDSSIQYLVGQGMKLSRGTANPQVLRELFEKSLR